MDDEGVRSISVLERPKLRKRSFKSLDGESDTLGFEIKGDDLRADLMAMRKGFVDVLEHVRRYLREMDEAIDAAVERDEDTKLGYLHDWTCRDISDPITLGDAVPWITFEALEGETDLLLLNADDLDADLVSDLREARWITDMTPIDLADVDETLDAIKCNEETIGQDTTHDSIDIVADLEELERLGALLHEGCLLRKDDLAAVLVDIDDAHTEGLADELLEMLHDTLGIGPLDARIVDGRELGYRNESLDAVEVDEETSLVGFVRDDGDDFFSVEISVELFDELDLAGFLKRKNDETGVFVIADDDGVDDTADLDFRDVFDRRVEVSSADNTCVLTVIHIDEEDIVRDENDSTRNDLSDLDAGYCWDFCEQCCKILGWLGHKKIK